MGAEGIQTAPGVEETDKKKPEKILNKLKSGLTDKIDKIDGEDNVLDDSEITDFLEGKNKKQNAEELGNFLEDHFETEGVIDEYKESIGKICEKILEKVDTIDSNKGKILVFYLMHFHNETDELGVNIINTIVNGTRDMSDFIDGKENLWISILKFFRIGRKRRQKKIEDKQGRVQILFNKLPRTKEVTDLKDCNEILSIDKDTRLATEEEDWLKNYRNEMEKNPKILELPKILKLDGDIKEKVQSRLDLEKCHHLLDSDDDLTMEDVDWLGKYNESGKAPDLKERIEAKVKEESLKICNKLLDKTPLASQELQWLRNYRDNGAKQEGEELMGRIDSKICEELLKMETLTKKDIQRLIDNKGNNGISPELLVKINTRICEELLKMETLTKKAIQRLIDNKGSNGISPELVGRIDKKICDEILKIEDKLSYEFIQWLKEYEKKGAKKIGQETINKIDIKISKEILRTGEDIRLSDEDIKWLEKCKNKGEKNMGKELIDEINKRLGLENAHKQVNEGADLLIFNDRIANLDDIDKGIKNLTPNRNLIVKNIKDAKQAEEKINIKNINQYLLLKGIKELSEPEKLYLTSNFKMILAKHLTYHPNYERGYGKDPKEKIIYGTLKDIAEENKKIEEAVKIYENLRNNKDLDAKIKTVMTSDKHILFDIWFRYEMSKFGKSDEQKQKQTKHFYDIFSKIKKSYIGSLDNYIRRDNNGFIKDMYQEYLEIEKKVKAANEEADRVKQFLAEHTKTVTLDDGKQITYYSDGKIHAGAYVGSDFQNEELKKILSDISENTLMLRDLADNLGLPRNLDPGVYIEFQKNCKPYRDEYNRLEGEEEKAVLRQVKKFGFNSLSELEGTKSLAERSGMPDLRKSDRFRAINQIRKDYEKLRGYQVINCAIELVKIYQKYNISPLPPDYMGIPLKRKYSDPDEVVRNTTWEHIQDKRDDIKETWNHDRQQAIGKIGGLVVGTIAAIAVSETGPLGQAVVFEAVSRVTNGAIQEAWNFGEMALKAFGAFEDNGNNRVDPIGASFINGMGFMKRENGELVPRPMGEVAIELVFNVGKNRATFGLLGLGELPIGETIGKYAPQVMKIVTNPYVVASLNNFVISPTFNCAREGTISLIAGGSFGDFKEGFSKQWSAEWSAGGWASKIVGTFVMGKTMEYMGKVVSELNGGEMPSCIQRLSECWQKISTYCKEHGVEIGKVSEKVVNKQLQNLVSSYMNTIKEGWKILEPIMTSALFTYNLISTEASPKTIVDRRIAVISDKLRSKNDPGMIENYKKMLAKYEGIKKDLQDELLSLNRNTSSEDNDNSLASTGKNPEDGSAYEPGNLGGISAGGDNLDENRIFDDEEIFEEYDNREISEEVGDGGSAYEPGNPEGTIVSEASEKLFEEVRVKEEIELGEDEIKPEDLLEGLPEGAEVEFKDGKGIDKAKSEQEIKVVVKVGDKEKEISMIVKIEEGKIKIAENADEFLENARMDE